MEIIEAFNKFSPAVQFILVLGIFATIFLVACNRNAGTNLTEFLQNLTSIFLQNPVRQRTLRLRSEQPQCYNQETWSSKGIGGQEGEGRRFNLVLEASNTRLSTMDNKQDMLEQ